VKKVAVVVLALALLMLFACFTPAYATPANTTHGTTPYGMGYAQVTGKLGDAAYIIQIPETWNGMLIVACPWYQYPKDATELYSHLKYDPIAQVLLSMGYAFACSNYGATGWPITEAVIRIHQLTQYVVGKYHVPGKVFVMGGSMGGCVAILVGEKYPELYSGVLDLCGAKDLVGSFNGCVWAAGLTLEEFRVAFGIPAEVPDEAVQDFQDFFVSVLNDILAETGGTPQTKPKVYAKIDPNQQTDISIPIISIYGSADIICPPSLVVAYHDALVAAGHGDLHRYYIIDGATHIDALIFGAVPEHLAELVAWSDSLD
jgi:pimeloyl-ACP methyl ester carboxylesterase